MCLTSNEPIEIKVVTDKPLLFYKILQKEQFTERWVTPHRRETVFLDEITKKNDGPRLPIKHRIRSDGSIDYVIEEGLHGYVNKEYTYRIANSWNIVRFPYKVFSMELPIGTNYAIGLDNGGAPAVVADRAIYKEFEEDKPKKKKVKKWQITINPDMNITPNDIDAAIAIKRPIYNSRAEAVNMLTDKLYIIREVEVDDDN